MSKYAVLVGINYYNTVNQLYGCINDVINVQNYLKTQKYTQFTIITDDTPVKPTKKNILDGYKTIVSKNTKESVYD